MLKYFKNFDWIMMILVGILVVIGLIIIYSISLGDGDFSNFKKQIIFIIIGFILIFLISLIDWRSFKENPYLILTIYFICIALLIGLFFFAPEIRGVQSWYKIGPAGAGLSFDPIGFTIITLMVLLAKFFSMRHI
ncbi:FtsW/RodA/SpoVE family cell cycle protein, partial [Patescibacteria group bacterium]|nr:FtsW/RodA/SpoVE family cell cycle protein [Patescibacteria group bacterium]